MPNTNGNLFLRICSVILSFTLVPCLIVNLLMFFGVDMSFLLKPFANLAGIDYETLPNRWNFDEYYFGFQSMINWFSDFPPVLTLEHFIEVLNEFLGSIFGLPQEFTASTKDIILLVVRAILLPINFLANSLTHILQLIILFIQDFSALLIWLGKMFVGFYNIPVYHNTNGYDWSTYVITTVPVFH